MGNQVQRPIDAPPLPPLNPAMGGVATAQATQTHSEQRIRIAAPSQPEAIWPTAMPASAFTIAPPPPPAVVATLSADTRAAAASGGSLPATSYPWTTVLPVVGCSSLLLGAGLAYGVSYGNRQAAKIEEFAEYEIKPEAEPEIEITPEMRRYAVRRGLYAFGLGTALCAAFGVGLSYAISRYWEVYSVPELSRRLEQEVLSAKDRVMGPLDRLPQWTRSTKGWFAQSWIGGAMRVKPPAAEGTWTAAQQLSDAENAELDALIAETDRMGAEWEESWNGTQAAAKQKLQQEQQQQRQAKHEDKR